MVLSDAVRYVVLPIFFTFLGTMLSAFIRKIQDLSEMKRANREAQMAKAIDICDRVIKAADKLLGSMKNDAWFVAWRKAILLETFTDDLVASDDAKWTHYNDLLTEWRASDISFDTELKGAFGENGVEANLFEEINAGFQELADMLWKVRFASKKDTPVFWSDVSQPAIVRRPVDLNAEDQEKHRDAFFLLLQQNQVKVSVLSGTMIHCIQNQAVGNLRLAVDPDQLSKKDKGRLEAAGSKAANVKKTAQQEQVHV